MQLRTVFSALAAFALACSLGPTPRPARTPPAAERLNALVEAYFEASLELNPILATFIGDHRYDDRLANDIGPEHRAASLALQERFLADLATIPLDELAGQDLLTYQVFRREREMEIEGFRYPTHLIPVSQFHSWPNFFAQLGSGESLQPFQTITDYENFLGRIRDFGSWVDQAIRNMREGTRRGVVQPRVLMEKALPQLAAHAVADVHESIFYRPIERIPESFDDAAVARIRASYEVAIAEQIVPVYRRLHDFIRDEYLPHTRSTVGMGALPNGAAWYAYLVRDTTTTNKTADEIHALGQREVARLRERAAAALGAGFDVREFHAQVLEDGPLPLDTLDAKISRWIEAQRPDPRGSRGP